MHPFRAAVVSTISRCEDTRGVLAVAAVHLRQHAVWVAVVTLAVFGDILLTVDSPVSVCAPVTSAVSAERVTLFGQPAVTLAETVRRAEVVVRTVSDVTRRAFPTTLTPEQTPACGRGGRGGFLQ